MSLDQNLFSLIVTPNKDDPTVLDLVSPSGEVHYKRQRETGSVYKIALYDPLSESLLATATAPSATSRHKTLELYNPNIVVPLDHTGRLTFKWTFRWEEHEFEWRREECYIIRKPDPPVMVAITKEPPGRIKTTSIQILDYNLNRFDVEDRKGLEIVILTSLLTFSDSSDAYHTPDATAGPPPIDTVGLPPSLTESPPPLLPPRPAPKTGLDRIAEIHAIRGEINEVTVSEEGGIDDYAQYCSNLLQDESMLFITVRSADASTVPKVLQVVEQTKRIRHKAGLSDEEELHQYVIYDTSPQPQRGPRIIKLDDDPADKKGKARLSSGYSPPTSLAVHLSKIPMPELQPKAAPSTLRTTSSTNASSSFGRNVNGEQNRKVDKWDEKHSKDEGKLRKEQEKDRKEEEKRRKEEEKRGKEEGKRGKEDAKGSHSGKHSKSPSTSGQHHVYAGQHHVYANQVHPHQPSPSPSQPNNPVIYTVPPPRPPHSPYSHPYGSSQAHLAVPAPLLRASASTGSLRPQTSSQHGNAGQASSNPGLSNLNVPELFGRWYYRGR